MNNTSINISRHDVIEGLKYLKLHRLLRFAYRFGSRDSKAGIPDLFVSTKLKSYWLRIKLGREKTPPVQKRFLDSQSNPIILHLDQKNGRLILYCKNTDLVLNHTLGQLALTFAKRTGRPWQLKQRPLIKAVSENQKPKEAHNGSL